MKNLIHETIMDKCTINEIIKFSSECYGNNRAIEWDDKTGRGEKSYFDLYYDTIKISKNMKLLNLNNKHVALWGALSYEWISTFYGVLKGGYIAVPLDRQMTEYELVKLLNESDSEILVYDMFVKEETLNYVKKYSAVKFFLSYKDILNIVEHKDNEETELPDTDIVQDSLAVIVFTSGTTGPSKGVMLTHRNLIADLGFCLYLFENEEWKNIVPILPPHHMFQITCGIQCAIALGVTISIGKGVKYAIQSMQQFKPTVLIMVPMIVELMYNKIFQQARQNKQLMQLRVGISLANLLLFFHIDIGRFIFRDIVEQFGGRLSSIVCGGAPLKKAHIKFFKCLGINIYEGYGITECSPVICANTGSDFKFGSVGNIKGKLFRDIKICNDEIWIKGDIVSVGYYNKACEENFPFSEGWFRTGDLGHIDAQGFLFIKGRIKNIIILDNGENVSPEEIENIYEQLPIVKSIMVHSTKINNNQILSVTVVPKDEFIADNLWENVEIEVKKQIESCEKYLAPHKRPHLIFVQKEDFEKTSIGKNKRNY